MDYNDLFMNQDLSSAEKVSWYVVRVANAFQDLLARAEAAEGRGPGPGHGRDHRVHPGSVGLADGPVHQKGGLTMERLTEKRDGQNVIPLRQNGKVKWSICSAGLGDAPTEYLYGEHADRLAAYEDTGLEPEEIIELKARMEGLEK